MVCPEKLLYIQILTALLVIHFSSSFSPPSIGIGSLLFKPKNIVTPNLGNDTELVDVSQFFTDSFWFEKNGGSKELSPKQYNFLKKSQLAEFRKRYGITIGKDRRAELLICKDNGLTKDIYGCAGIEVSKICTTNGKSTKFPAPLMSNLAVCKRYRRKGLAEDLVRAAEELALKEWGYDECYLFVEKKNTPALRLYRKLGYKILWEDDTATTLTPTEKGNVTNKPTVILCMRKSLGKGFFRM